MKEIVSLRKPREKYFKHANGLIDVYLFDSDVHYQKDGMWKNIDNSWIETDDCYLNKANSFHVYLSKKKTEELMKMNLGSDEFSIFFPNKSKNVASSIKEQSVYYENILQNIDIKYEFIKNKLKDTIILKNIENNFSDLQFKLTDTAARLENNQIILEKNGRTIGKLESPTLLDNQNNSYSIKYILNKNPDGDTFTFEIDENVLKNKDLYPLIIDPILSNNEENSVFDTYIYEGDENADRNNSDILKVGVDQNNKVYRSLLKFNLPTIGTGCDIVAATATLISHRSDYNNTEDDLKQHSGLISVHEVTSNWDETTAKWENLKNAYNPNIEAYFNGTRSLYDQSKNTINLNENKMDITNLVKRWYAGYPNNGMMLKFMNETYNQEKKEHSFYSKNNTITETSNPKPFLIISYRNQNGLEDYMTYHNISFHDGETHINNLTGNLTNVFELNQTISGKMPATLSLIYNTNDVILTKDYGYGLGYKLNYHQLLQEIKLEDQDYLELLDADGTTHYFYKENEIFHDEDGLNLTITKENDQYILKDKLGNQKIFIKNGNTYYLQKIKNTENDEIKIEYTDHKISKITDANQEEITITYNNSGFVTNSNYTSSLIALENNQVVRLTTKSGTTIFEYNNNLISKMKDINNKSLKLEYYETIPYRLKKITELGVSNSIGNSLEFHYEFQVTRVIDVKGRVKTYSFNNQGNTIGVTNLKSSNDFLDSYGNYQIYDDKKGNTKNRLLLDAGSMKYTRNIVMDREEKVVNGSGIANFFVSQPSSEESLHGAYHVSGMFKTTQDNVKIELVFYPLETFEISLDEFTMNKTEEYQKYDLTISSTNEAMNYLYFKVTTDNENTVTYIKDIQVEPEDSGNCYNQIINSDFRNNMANWTSNNTEDQIVTLSNGVKAYYRTSLPNQTKSLSQTMTVNGKKGDSYRLSFWYKNTGIHQTDGKGHTVSLTFQNEEGSSETTKQNLKNHGSEWQFFNLFFTTKSDYKKIIFKIDTLEEVNDLYVTQFTLTKDLRNTSYEYDQNGNLILVSNEANEKEKFYYDKDNQLIGMFEPKGNHFNFEYDNHNPNKLIQGLSTKGIANKIDYNEFNNPIKTTIKNDNFALGSDTEIYIRCKGTNKYLVPNHFENTVELVAPGCNRNSWVYWDFSDNDCCIFSNLMQRPLIIKEDKSLGLGMGFSNFFKSVANENGSYSLKDPNTNLAITVNNNEIKMEEYEKDNAHQQFYFEKVKKEEYIETRAEYTEDGKFLKKTIDALDRVTTFDIDLQTGLVNSITDANNHKKAFTYDSKEQLYEIKDNTAEKVRFERNMNNVVTRIITNNKIYDLRYDDFLNIKSISLDSQKLADYEYEENNGNLVKVNYGNNTSIEYTYDEFDRIKEVKKDKTYTHYYNNKNELVKIKSEDENFDYYYDFAGRIKKLRNNQNKIEYDYDANSNVTQKEFDYLGRDHFINYTYDEDDTITKVSFDDQNLNYTFDHLGRLINSNINGNLPVTYEYMKQGNKTSFIIKKVKVGNDIYEYTYDNVYNIKSIKKNNKLTNEYNYDKYDQLISENNYLQNKTTKYTYNSSGNLLTKKQYEIKSDNLLKEDKYSYNIYPWGDRITKFNNTEITYDQIGNPVTIGNQTLSWQNGRELKQLTTPSQTIHYTYNKDGIRKSKTINNVTTTYFTENSAIIFEETNNNMLYFIRDDNNKLLGFKYNDTIYYYQKNIQEDITGIYDSNYNLIATYEYDSWGKILSIKDNQGNDLSNNSSHIANINPFRYRSYYYDKEVELYYLNSRYYNPEWGKFINADGIIGSSMDHLGYNLYVYGSNNPIMNIDPKGESILGALAGLGVAAEAAKALMGGLGVVAAYEVGVAALPTIIKQVTTAVTTIQESINKARENKKEQTNNQNVYVLYNNIEQRVDYVGRTNDIARREAEHKRNPDRAHLELRVQAKNVSYDEARGLEQALIIKYGTINSGNKGCNKRNGISPTNPRYNYYMAAAARLYGETYVGEGIIWTPKN